MFSCSAKVWSSATDFCFSSAISTRGTPGADGLASMRAGMGTMNGQDPAGLDGVCDGPSAGRLYRKGVVTGSFTVTKEHQKVERSTGRVKRPKRKSLRPERPLHCATLQPL